jgi:hypothetical protein
MSGAFAYREPCQLCLTSEVAQLAHRGGNANRNYFEWAVLPSRLRPNTHAHTAPSPRPHRP